MMKKFIAAAILTAPAFLLATPSAHAADVVIRVHAPVQTYERFAEYRPSYGYQRGYNPQGHKINWVNQEQARQRASLVQGMRSGELTREEVERLQREQTQIRHLEQRALADRYLSPNEFAKLQEELREANRHIYAQKHDRQDRDYRYARW